MEINIVISKVHQDGKIKVLLVEKIANRLWPRIMQDAIDACILTLPGLYIGSWIDSLTNFMQQDCLFTVEEDPTANRGLSFFQGWEVSAPTNVTRWPPKR